MSTPRRLLSTSSKFSSTASFPAKAAKFFTFDIKNFYLQIPLDQTDYVQIKLSNNPQGFIDEYKLMDYVRVNGWVYFEIL